MPGFFPGAAGFAAFAGLKFGGYVLAGIALKKLQPAITASAAKIAFARTAFGVLIGPPIAIGAVALVESLHLPDNRSTITLYPSLFALRVLIWALVIFIFTRRTELTERKLWLFSAVGAVWSCLLDVPAVALALVSPGRIPIC